MKLLIKKVKLNNNLIMNNLIVKYEQQIILALLFFVALALRLINIDFSFSNDELSAVMRCHQDSFSDLITKGVLVDFHPAGVQSFMYFWIKLFGEGEFAVRFPFAVFGSLAVVFAYIYTQRKFGSTPALLTAIALIVLEFPLLHGQIARPYSSGLMLSMLLILLWDKVIFPKKDEEKNIIKNLVLLSIVFAANAYNHYFSALFAGILFVSGLFAIKKELLLKYILFGAFAFILFLPHLSITIKHMTIGGIGSWLGKPSSDFLVLHIQHIFNDSLALTLLITNITMLFLIINKRSILGKWKTRNFLLMLFLLPFLIAFFYSIYVNPVLQDRVLLFTMPFLLIFIFSFFNNAQTKFQNALIWIIPFTLIGHTVFIGKYYEKEHFINFKKIAEYCSSTHKMMDNNEVLSLQHCNSKEYLQYYLQDTSINFSINEITTDEQLFELKQILQSEKNKQFVEYISTKPQNRIATMMISSLYQISDIFDPDKYSNGYHYYGKSENWLRIDTNNQQIIKYTNYSKDTINLKDIEYSKGIEYQSNRTHNLVLDMRFNFRCQNKRTESMIVYSSENINEENENIWWSAPLKYFTNQEWNPVSFQIPMKVNRGDKIKVYIWNPKKESIFLSDYEIGIFEKQ